MISEYYRLTKPGIVYGNLLSALAGYLFIAHSAFSLATFLAMFGGLALIIASACVVNNYIDRDIDARMERTKSRAMPNQRISATSALTYAGALLALGSLLLILFVNLLSLWVALAGFVLYIAFYTPIKRISAHATLVGALSGAVPPVVGYVAVTNMLDLNALLLFLVLLTWQMPHFLAIAIYRSEEYRAAGVPVFSIVHGVRRTQALMFSHIIAFTLAGYALLAPRGGVAVWIITFLSLAWLSYSAYGFFVEDTNKWARKMFFISLIMLVTLCGALAFA